MFRKAMCLLRIETRTPPLPGGRSWHGAASTCPREPSSNAHPIEVYRFDPFEMAITWPEGFIGLRFPSSAA
jgi:hypothetical protein